MALADSPSSINADWARIRQRCSERRLSTTSMTATERRPTARAETMAVSIGWLAQNPAIRKSDPATATSRTIARTAAARRPGRSLDIAAIVGSEGREGLGAGLTEPLDAGAAVAG